MIVIVGCIVVLVAVLTGFSMAGGNVMSLVHLSEFVTIGGASMGALIVMSPKKVLADLVRAFIQAVKGTPFNKPMYVELFSLLAEMARIVRRDGMLALEPLVANPQESQLLMQ